MRLVSTHTLLYVQQQQHMSADEMNVFHKASERERKTITDQRHLPDEANAHAALRGYFTMRVCVCITGCITGNAKIVAND